MFALLKSVAIASTLLLLLNNAAVVDSAASFDPTPICYEDSLTYICVGSRYYTSPSPGSICDDPNDISNCTTFYEGGWSWEYAYVDTDKIDELESNFESGNFTVEAVDDATIATIRVSIDDDKSTCAISVTMPGKETQQCSICSAQGCFTENSTDINAAVQFDCTNLETGRASNSCESLEPFLNPVISLSSPSSLEGEAVGGGVFVDESGNSQSMLGSGEEEMTMVGSGVFVDEDGNSQTMPAEGEEMTMVGGGVFVDEDGNSQSMGSSSSSSGSSREQIGTSEMGKGQKTEVMSTPQSSSSSIIQTGRRIVGLVLLISAATAAVASMSY